MTPPKELAADEPLQLKAQLHWLVCSEATCLPGETELALQLPVALTSPQANHQWRAAFEEGALQTAR